MNELKRIVKKVIKWGFIGMAGLIAVMMWYGFNFGKPAKQLEADRKKWMAESSRSSKPKPVAYEKLSYKDNGNVENFSYLYTGSDKSKENLEKISREIKSKECKKQCNISLFDDKKAFELDQNYSKLTSQAEINSWKEKNYVFVAEHLLGYLEFEGDGTFIYFPYKDWYYKELKAK